MRRRALLRSGAAALGAGVTAQLAAGCGSDGGSGGGGGRVNLRYAIWDANQAPAMQAAVKEFERRNPGVHVTIELTPYTQYWPKMQTAAIGGTSPDVMWMSTIFFQLYAKYGQMLPLAESGDSAAMAAVHSDRYPKALVDAYIWKGKLYALPKDYDTIALWYNKRLFDRAGVDHPTAEWTWADLKDAARRTTDRKRRVYGFASELSGQSGFYNFIYQGGGSVITKDGRRSGYDSARTIEALKFDIGMIREGISPTLGQLVDSTGPALFQSERVAMATLGSWLVPQLATIPAMKKYADLTVLAKGRTRASITNGLGNVVMKSTRHPELAKKLALWMSSKRCCELQAKSGVVIPSYRGTESIWLAANKQWNLRSYIDEVPYAVPFPHSVNTSAWQNDEAVYLPQAWSGDDSIEGAARKMAAAMNLDLKKERAK
jgi:multiple sugar transport system substrate-binding protein